MILPPGTEIFGQHRVAVVVAGLFCLGLMGLSVKDGWHLSMEEAVERGYYKSSFARAWRQAGSGDAEAQNILGNHYYLGLGIAPNYERAASWYRKAAFNGNLAAQVNMGLLHATGKGLPLDLERAYGWFRIARRNGNHRAKIYVDYMDERYSMAPNMMKDVEMRFRTLEQLR